MAEPLSPDTGEVLRAWLGSESAVTTVVGTRISDTLQSASPSVRYALIDHRNLGGGAVWARYQVECWGPGSGADDDGSAGALARNIISIAPQMHGMIGGATVAGATADRLLSQPDPVTNRPRTIVEVTFIATP